MSSKNAWARREWRKRPFQFFFKILPFLYSLRGWKGVRIALGIYLGVYK